jgi:hypothetical protein
VLYINICIWLQCRLRAGILYVSSYRLLVTTVSCAAALAVSYLSELSWAPLLPRFFLPLLLLVKIGCNRKFNGAIKEIKVVVRKQLVVVVIILFMYFLVPLVDV